jgi:hypothetical protein
MKMKRVMVLALALALVAPAFADPGGLPATNVRVTQNEADIADLQTNGSAGTVTNTTNISNNATNISNNTTSIGSIRNDVSTNTTDIATNSTYITTNSNGLVTTNYRIDNTNDRVDENWANITNNSKSIKSNSSDIAENSGRISNLENAFEQQGRQLRDEMDGVRAMSHSVTNARPFIPSGARYAIGTGLGVSGNRVAVAIGAAAYLDEGVTGSLTLSNEMGSQYSHNNTSVGAGLQWAFK